jgi:hypothetical protein
MDVRHVPDGQHPRLILMVLFPPGGDGTTYCLGGDGTTDALTRRWYPGTTGCNGQTFARYLQGPFVTAGEYRQLRECDCNCRTVMSTASPGL